MPNYFHKFVTKINICEQTLAFWQKCAGMSQNLTHELVDIPNRIEKKRKHSSSEESPIPKVWGAHRGCPAEPGGFPSKEWSE